MEYKGYSAKVEFDENANIFHGEVINLRDVITFEGETVDQTPPPYEKLIGDLSGACSRRINIQHRVDYQILDDIKTVKVIRMWTHYE